MGILSGDTWASVMGAGPGRELTSAELEASARRLAVDFTRCVEIRIYRSEEWHYQYATRVYLDYDGPDMGKMLLMMDNGKRRDVSNLVWIEERLVAINAYREVQGLPLIEKQYEMVQGLYADRYVRPEGGWL